tara:strand:- start:4443 stop:9434 length:4992 start_codon:yes stop_codon:yes gene_type:complete
MLNFRCLVLILASGLGSTLLQCSALEPIAVENLEAELERLSQVPEGDRASEAYCNRAAAINRLLFQLSADEQYRILKEFTFSSGSEDIQAVSAICDVVAPPTEFARLIGARPTENTFAIPSVANVDGLFSTAWLLVESADDLGLLRVLTNEVESLPGSRAIVLRAILLASQSGNEDKVRSIIEQLANEKTFSSEWVRDAAVLCCVCRQLDNCSDVLEKIRSSVLDQQSVSPTAKAFLARTQFSTREQEVLGPFRMNKDWITVGKRAGLYSHDNHITHLAGSDAYYVYRYPLTGDFRFQVQQIDPENEDACLIQYANRVFGLKPFFRPGANLREIEKSGDRFRAWLNGYPLGDFPMDSTSPWIVLDPNGNVTERFRFMKLTGSPTIPREVKLIGNESSSGWTSSDNSDDLSTSNGVLESAKSQSSHQRIVRHYRPLQSGETFEYEYFASEQHVAHPAVGPLAFLLEPDGVKLHWVTKLDDDWSGLSVDNELVEPLNRRGPRKLPIRSSEWNHVSLSLNDNQLTIRLNDTLVYSRSLQPDDDTRFGWYHNPSEKSIRVRNAALRGEWPKSLDIDTIAESRGTGAPSALASVLFREHDIGAGVLQVSEEASRLKVEDRYDYLSKWVLPSEWHRTLRLNSDFTSMHSLQPTTKDVNDPGGNLISPALELIDVAEQLGRLNEIAERARLYASEDIHQQRNRSAFLALIHHRLGSHDETMKHAETLFRLTEQADDEIAPRHLWSGYLVSRMLNNEPDFHVIVRDLLALHQLPRLDPEFPIEFELNRMWNSYRHNDLEEFAERNGMQLKQWQPTARYETKWRSLGHAQGEWLSIPGGVRHIPSHSHDLLFFESPLLGNYEFQFEQQNAEFGDIQVVAGGARTKVEDGETVITGGDETAKVETLIAPPLGIERPWIHQRYVVRDGVLSVHVNGRKVHQRDVFEGYPWLALCADDESTAVVRNMEIMGAPAIPSSLELVHPRLPGWRSYYSPGIKNANGAWTHQDGSIVGLKEDFPKGSGRERMLYYQRPLKGSDAVEYEFFYKPGSTIVHPALDRMAFVVTPEGIQLHYVTDGQDDKTFHDKTNMRFEPTEQRERPSALLIENQWNKARISLHDNSMQMQLNGTVVYQHELSPDNQRLFGLFYFSDQTSANVRNVVLHGSWPTKLATASEQQLADPQLVQLNASRDMLAGRMIRDFAEESIPDKLFNIQGRALGTYTKRPEGLELTVPGAVGQRQSGILGRFRLSGDFDISAEFDSFRSDLGNNANSLCSVRLDVVLDGEDIPLGTIQRYGIPGRQKASGSFVTRREDGVNVRTIETIDWESSSSTFRIARRGDKMFLLIKDGDALGFRLFRTFQIPTTPCNQIRLMTVAANAAATGVVWKRLDVRADDISTGDKPIQKVLFVANADGSGLRQIEIGSNAQGINGSPHFSPDGKQVVFHAGTGRPSLSRVFVVNSDGTGLKDLGPGGLPIWMPDGKQIAFCSPSWDLALMKPDGSERQVIYQNGWAIQVSPDGREALFKDFGAAGSQNLTVMDLKTQQKRQLLNGEARRYGNLYWNFAWSPDGKWISFYGTSRMTGKHEFAVVSTKGSDHGFRVLMKDADDFFPRTSWHPDGDRILIGRRPKNQQSGAYLLKLSDQDYCEPLFEATGIARAEPPAWSSDGSQIVFMGVAAE